MMGLNVADLIMSRYPNRGTGRGMRRIRYARERGGEIEVEVGFQPGWIETTISFRGTPVGTVETRQELESGREFSLVDNVRLAIHLPKSLLPVPKVTLDGQP